MGNLVFKAERPERRKEIKGYGGRYEVSDLGKVYSGGFELSQIDGRYVNLSWKGIVERVGVAYLVARAFLGNVRALPYVVHLDGDGRNNRVENLAWSERREGRRGGRRMLGANGVMAYTVEGELVGRWRSVHEASEALGVGRWQIRQCAEGKMRKSKGYVFRYV